MINSNNCETWFLLYADGELSEAERALVEQFLEVNPDFHSTFDQLQGLKFFPDKRVVFADPSLLKSPLKQVDIDLDESAYRFEPDLSVSFPNKQLLYKTEVPLRQVGSAKRKGTGDTDGMGWRDGGLVRKWTVVGVRFFAAAATVTAIGMLWFFFNRNNAGVREQSIALAYPVNPGIDTAVFSPAPRPEVLQEDSMVRQPALAAASRPSSSTANKVYRSSAMSGSAGLSNSITEEIPGKGYVNSASARWDGKGRIAAQASISGNETVTDETMHIRETVTVDTEASIRRQTLFSSASTSEQKSSRTLRSNLSPELLALSAERMTVSGLTRAVPEDDHTVAVVNAEPKRSGLRSLLDKINMALDKELGNDQDKKYIQVASFNIPLSKGIKQ